MEIILILVVLGLAGSGALVLSRRFSRSEDPVETVPPPAPTVPVVDGVVEDRTVHSTAAAPIGYRLRHTQARSSCVVVPVMAQPLPAPHACPTCRTAHVVKSIHLWLDDQGYALVSKGVLDSLRLAGLEQNNLIFEGSVSKPPPLRVGHGVSRAEIDQNNRKIVQYKVV